MRTDRFFAIVVGILLAVPLGAQDEGREIRVGAGEAVTSLSAALAAAEDGDLIRLLPGRYAEGSLTIERSVTIEAAGAGVVIDGGGEGTVLTVTADGVTLRGLEIVGTGFSNVRDHSAIRVQEARGCRIEDNHIRDAFFGIYLARVDGCSVTGNTLSGSSTRVSASGNGIHLWNARNVEVERNRVTGHRDGIYFEFATDSQARRNSSTENLRYGLHLMFSNGTDFENNVFRRNGSGVAVMFSERVRMVANRFEENWGSSSYGLLIKDLRDSEIVGNRLVRNTVALHSEGSDRIEIRGNVFLRNGRAVRLYASSQQNEFVGNDFIANAFDVTTNSRQHFNHFGGNFWSSYRGYDLTGDGYGDVPHRPVRLFALIVERNPTAIVLLRSVLVDLLDLAERVVPVLTPETLADERPSMRTVAS